MYVHVYICMYVYVCMYVYGTGNSIQYSVMTYTEESKKSVDICMCITDSLFHAPETNTAL